MGLENRAPNEINSLVRTLMSHFENNLCFRAIATSNRGFLPRTLKSQGKILYGEHPTRKEDWLDFASYNWSQKALDKRDIPEDTHTRTYIKIPSRLEFSSGDLHRVITPQEFEVHLEKKRGEIKEEYYLHKGHPQIKYKNGIWRID